MAKDITPIEMTNKALVLIGALPITSFNETTAEAVVANQIYEDIVLDAISKHDWSFATGQIDLTNNRLSDTPLTQYSAAYQAPTNPRPVSYMRLWINGNLSAFDVSEDMVLANAALGDTVVLQYQFRPAERRWLPAFRWYVVYRLASEFASTITRKADEIELWTQKASQQFETARLRDDKGRISPWMDSQLLNEALALIGALPVTQVTQTAIEALIAHGLLDEVTDQALAAHDWTFAMQQAKLSLDDTYTSYRQRDRAYTAPSDMLAPFRVWVDQHNAAYSLEGEHVLVDLDQFPTTPDTVTVAMEYKARAPSDTWLPAFRWYVIYRIASELQGAVGGATQFGNVLDQKAERQLTKARRENDQGRSPPRLNMRTSRLTRARRSAPTVRPK